VAYYHNPDYQRQKQLPLKDVQSGRYDINTLASLLQIYPNIKLLYDDDDIHGKMMQWVEEIKNRSQDKPPRYLWAWILTSSRKIYLMRWSSVTFRHTVFYNTKQPNILGLVHQFYLSPSSSLNQGVHNDDDDNDNENEHNNRGGSGSNDGAKKRRAGGRENSNKKNQVMAYFHSKFSKGKKSA
jgi:hypothetical protein